MVFFIECLEYSKAIYIKQEYYDIATSRNQFVHEPKCLIQKIEGMIVGGKNASLGEFPHMVYIYILRQHSRIIIFFFV